MDKLGADVTVLVEQSYGWSSKSSPQYKEPGEAITTIDVSGDELVVIENIEIHDEGWEETLSCGSREWNMRRLFR